MALPISRLLCFIFVLTDIALVSTGVAVSEISFDYLVEGEQLVLLQLHASVHERSHDDHTLEVAAAPQRAQGSQEDHALHAVDIVKNIVKTVKARERHGKADPVGNAVTDVLDSVSNINLALQSFQHLANSSSDPLKDITDGIKHAAIAGKAMAKTAIDASNAYGSASSGIASMTSNKPLGGSSPERINQVLAGVFLSVTSIIALVYAVETNYPQIYTLLNYGGPENSRPALWVLTMLFVSYLLLIPALEEVLFSFKVGANFMGMSLCLTSSQDGERGPITESTLEVIRLLYNTGSTIGACLVTLYAIIVPALKVILLGLGEYLREGSPVMSRSCILIVQFISKWACPDMFAYILLLYLIRHLPKNSGGIVEAPSKLDVGFSCFSVFCVLSTFSSLAIKPPPKAANPEDNGDSNIFATIRPKLVFPITVTLTAVFAVLLFVGLDVPCMGLEINEDALIVPRGPVPVIYKPLLEGLHLADMINAKVPVWHCVIAMGGYAWNEGEGNCILAIIMLLIFALVLPICSMISLAMAAWQLLDGSGTNTSMPVAKVLAKISMLDVFCMGVVVVTVAGSMYKSMGINIFLQPGIAVLISAEIVHYFTYWFVQGAVEAHSEPKDAVSDGAEDASETNEVY